MLKAEMDRAPLQGNLLVTTRRILESLNHKVAEPVKDRTGRVYGFKMLAPSGLPYVLIAKGSNSLGDLVSTQQDLVESWHAPLVLAWKRMEDLNTSFYVFDPEAVWTNKAFVNDRWGVKMVNFSLELGRPWKIEDPLDDVWRLLTRKRSASLTTFMEPKP